MISDQVSYRRGRWHSPTMEEKTMEAVSASVWAGVIGINQNGAAYQSIAAWQPLSNRKRGLVLFLTAEKIPTKVA